MKRTGGLIGLVILGVVMAVWLIARSDFVARDDCLDAGGRWADGECEGARPGG
ncbi:hypothetical protein [Brevundimonas sp.]|uniref:hypothetical protein n=1 Tax=Brevundimonas sp. TaxID=1871086 RepID=UPI002D72E7E3|nr:hypothetical protein [Brevundimonas sp.]HYC68195.1 hypothetical protein [Brevundimonas sp.]